jgi:hypothetical protein
MSYLPDPEHVGLGIVIGDIQEIDLVGLVEQILPDVHPRYPWCLSWPCDCDAYAILGQRCEWDRDDWYDPAVEYVIPVHQRELVRIEEGDRVLGHRERHAVGLPRTAS